MSDDHVPERLTVAKTYKLAIGGSFPRAQSGLVYPVHDAGGEFRANAARASRKDVRDAVAAARAAATGWAGAAPYNRGQVLYRVAELLEGRREEFTTEETAATGASTADAARTVELAIDRLVWYAGWTDKIGALLSSQNPVAGPYFSTTTPEPAGVVGILAPPRSPLLGLVSVLAPALATGNTAVVLASPEHPLPAVTFAEVLATADVPGGVANTLTGPVPELAPWLAGHAEVNALDLSAAPEDLRVDLERAAAEAVTRVVVNRDGDFTDEPGIRRLRAYTELKTMWHPMGN